MVIIILRAKTNDTPVRLVCMHACELCMYVKTIAYLLVWLFVCVLPFLSLTHTHTHTHTVLLLFVLVFCCFAAVGFCSFIQSDLIPCANKSERHKSYTCFCSPSFANSTLPLRLANPTPQHPHPTPTARAHTNTQHDRGHTQTRNVGTLFRTAS